MLKEVNTKRFLLLVAIIFTISMLRLAFLPLWNIAPIAGALIFGVALFRNSIWGFLIPMVSLLVSDIFIELIQPGNGFYAGMWLNYLAYIGIGALALTLRGNIKLPRILATAVGGSIVFFLISNLSAWLTLPIYTKDLSGLLFSYEMGLPFFTYTFIGNVAFTMIFFGIYALVKQRAPQLIEA